MKRQRETGGTLSRHRALSGRPLRVEPLTQEQTADGGLVVTASVGTPRWQRWFGSSGSMRRKFELDACGREVYEACTGEREAQEIVRHFAETHRVSVAEAEISVAKFLSTLMARGLVVMQLDSEEEAR